VWSMVKGESLCLLEELVETANLRLGDGLFLSPHSTLPLMNAFTDTCTERDLLVAITSTLLPITSC
jgi:hypothetical protein